MQKRWRIFPHDPGRIAALARAAGVSPVLAQLLLSRGLDEPQRAKAFLAAKLGDLREPADLPGVVEAAGVLDRAIRDGKRIVVYGDYDVDGMTGTAILWRCLKLLGADVRYFVPHRLEQGYGLHTEALESLAADKAQLVVTVDCGISSLAEAEAAARLGLELIITDHHELAERLPSAAAIVHPRRPDGNYPFDGLSGSGVAFKLAWALAQQANRAKKVSPAMRRFLVQAVALAALGTVADVVPLVDENRILVRHGLASLGEEPTVGLAALLRVTELDKKRALASEDIGFVLAPRLNAAGRLGQAQLAVELLTTDNPQRAAALAEYLHELNNSRQSLEQSIYLAANKQAREQFDPEGDPALVLAGHGWHPGVIGIVAGRLAEKFHRPVVLIALDELGVKPGTGSGRSVPGFDLHQGLSQCSEFLSTFGGHQAAAGLKIVEDQVDGFRAAFCAHVAEAWKAESRVSELLIDAETPLSALTHEAVTQLEKLAPFGAGNSRPLLCTSDIRLVEPPRRIGGGGRHLSLKVAHHGAAFRAVAFGRGEWADVLVEHQDSLSLAYRPVINEFRGRRNVELQLADWKPAKAPVARA